MFSWTTSASVKKKDKYKDMARPQIQGPAIMEGTSVELHRVCPNNRIPDMVSRSDANAMRNTMKGD